jgi:hypothetical protein
MVMDGPTGDCIDYYTRNRRVEGDGEVGLSRPVGAAAWMTRVRLFSEHGKGSSFSVGDRLGFEIEFASDPLIDDLHFGYVIRCGDGTSILNANTRFLKVSRPEQVAPRGTIRCDLGMVPLMPGSYSITLWLGRKHGHTHLVENSIDFEVYERDIWGNGQLPPNDSHLWWPTSFSFESAPV